MEDKRVPLTLLTGFLGAGKTTLLNNVLADTSAGRVAVIVNEFGEAGLDHDLMEQSSEEVILMQSGCLCCSIRGDLSNNYKTIPSVYGEIQAKVLISLLVCFCFGVFFLLHFFYDLHGMLYYFIISLVFLSFFITLLWRFSKTNQLIFLQFGIKALILLGIICLPLLKIPV